MAVCGPCNAPDSSYFITVLRKIAFVKPSRLTLAKILSAGPEWLHEIKFDGRRAQVHIDEGEVTIYSNIGAAGKVLRQTQDVRTGRQRSLRIW